MNIFLLLVIFGGLVLMVVGYINSQMVCPPRKTEYRFIEPTVWELQTQPVPLTDIFAKMFYESTPWINHSWTPLPAANLQQRSINKNFISQS